MEQTAQETDLYTRLLGQVANDLEADVYLYSGPVQRHLVHRFTEQYPSEATRPNALLFLTTLGGDPDAAYILARSLKRKYKSGKFLLYVVGYCKSAGTLIASGADEIIMSDLGELGPLDVQMQKEDSLGRRGSGLDIFAALNYINGTAYTYFSHQFKSVIEGSNQQIATKTAAEIATNLASQLLTPITAQVDPVRLGENWRAVQIAQDYGERLGVTPPDVIRHLTSGYPSHGFVIDVDEAKELFSSVREPSASERMLERALHNNLAREHDGDCLRMPHKEGIQRCLTPAASRQQELALHADERNAAEEAA